MIGRGKARRTTVAALGGALACALPLLACDPEPVVDVRVCGDVQVPEQVDALRVSLLDEGQAELFAGVHDLVQLDPAGQGGASDGGEALDGGASDGGTGDAPDGGPGDEADGGVPADCLAGTAKTLPVSFELRGGRGRTWVRVEALREGVVVSRTDARAEVPPRGAVEVTLPLTADCLGMQCPLGQTCVRGQCEIAVFGGDPLACEGAAEAGEEIDVCLPAEEVAP